MIEIYKEEKTLGNCYRNEQLDELTKKIEEMRTVANKRREEYFTPNLASTDEYIASIEKYRQDFIKMLGFPLTEYSDELDTPEGQIEFVAEDELSKIYRVHIKALDGITTYGILFLPHTPPPYSLVIAQHGGDGTPEICSGFFNSANYNDMTRRVLKRGNAVFAPQLLLWNEEFGPKFDRIKIDSELKQLGGSITAMEIFKIIRSIDFLIKNISIDTKRIGMIGLSYGGFYTLFTTAIDTRIKVALSSCFFNDRFKYDWLDWVWFNSGNQFLDVEVCKLICPRPIYIEIGKNDELFDYKYAIDNFTNVIETYKALNVEENVELNIFEGVHELNKKNEGIDFLCRII